MQLKTAIRLHQKGQLARARTGYERILKKDPNQPDALLYLGVLFHQLKHSERAVGLIRKSLDSSPDFLAAHQNLGNIYQETGKTADALECYQKVTTLNPADAEGHSNLCIALQHLGRLDEAIESGRKATALAPKNKVSWVNLANALTIASRFEEAIECYQQSLALDNRFYAAHSGLCHCTYRWERSTKGVEGKKMEKTLAAYQQWLEADPDNPVSKYMLAACTGDASMTRSPEDFVTVLFDDFAANFDQNLARLNYRVPTLVAGLVNDVMDYPSAQYNVLDAGCGTGLLAADLKPFARCLTGVDLSSGMLEKAKMRGMYDHLIKADLTRFLSNKETIWDLIVCADTLCYFGQLDEIIKLMAESLGENGILISSFEHLKEDGQGYRLNPNGRYSHTETYLQSCFNASGLTVLQTHSEDLRKEGGQPVAGLIFVVRKRARS
jgi:predicted TPR repeat methyltransferase